ncbi:hypothetical protein [Bartonella harrusi]|uniref:Uncharacterized protein n=1 Tax=Bartonella harrusi TaxID=2961895 RepID=A0ABY5ERK5_9HYPH|nr:hypothetical protein [Bartonella harrusi]UTO28034.1 hypothetical protein NMK50_07440 [Bartonella harrusi]
MHCNNSYLSFCVNVIAKEQAVVEAPSSVAVNGKEQNGKNQFACNSALSSYQYNDGKTHYISEKTYQKIDGKSDETVVIQASQKNTPILGKNITIKDALNPDDLNTSFWKYGIVADNSGSVEIEKGVIEFTKSIAVQTRRNEGQITLKGVSITEKGERVMCISVHERNSVFQMSGYRGAVQFLEGEVKASDAHGVSLGG